MTRDEKYDSYAKIINEMEALKKRKQSMEEDIISDIEKKVKGSVKFETESGRVLDITFRQNTSFSDKELVEAIYAELDEKGDELFSYTFKEKTGAMEKYLKTAKGKIKDKILSIRVVKDGSPAFKLK